MRKEIYIICLALIIIIFPLNVKAKTLNNYKSDLKKLENKAALNEEKKEQKKTEIKDTNNKIGNTQNSIEQAQNNIVKAQEEIVELNKEIDNKEEEIKELIRFDQLSSGENSYLEFLFGAKSIADFVYRSSVVEQLSKYNDETIHEMNDLIEKNKKKQEELKQLQEKLNKLQQDLKKQLTTQVDSLRDISEDGMDIQDEISEMKKTIKTYEKLGCKPNQDVSRCVDVPVGTGFSRPTSTGVITSYFGYRNTGISGASRYHPAIDIGVSPGTPVYASAPGKVISVDYNSTMGYYVRINHNVNGSSYNTVYQHNSRNVAYVGQKVTKATLIAYSGSSGIGSGPHLHFGISRGYFTGYSKFVANAVNPKSVIYFPSGYWSSRAY